MKNKVTIISDCDGVLTNGKYLYDADGKFAKEYGPHDNDGVKLLKSNGFDIIFVSADKRGFEITKKRIDDMNCQLFNITEGSRYDWINDTYGIENVIYIGDGIHDAKILKDCYLGIATMNARPEAKINADYITEHVGGDGALLDAANYILNHNRNSFDNIKNKVLEEINNTLLYLNDKRLNILITEILNFKDKKIICVAAGRMGYSLRAFAMRLMHLGFNNVSFIGDTNVPYADEDTLCIFNTSSGNTATNVLYASQAKQNGSKIITITEAVNSDIKKYSDIYLILNNVESFQPMKTRSEQSSYILFDIVVKLLMNKMNISNSELIKNHSILE